MIERPGENLLARPFGRRAARSLGVTTFCGSRPPYLDVEMLLDGRSSRVRGVTTDDAFASFFAARLGSLWRAAWLLTGDHQRAEDLVQTAVAACYRKFDELGPDSFEPYLRRAMYTTFLSWRKRRWTGEVPVDALPDIADGATSADDHHDLVRALLQLPRAQRAVIVLRHLDDLTERQTAEVLGISVGTVKSHNARALASLRSDPNLRTD